MPNESTPNAKNCYEKIPNETTPNNAGTGFVSAKINSEFSKVQSGFGYTMFVLYVCTSTNGSVYQLLKYNKTQKSNPRKPESSVPTKFFVHQVRCVLRGQRLHRAGHPARGGGRLPGRKNCPQTQTTARREPGRSNPSKKDKYKRKGKGRRCFLGDVLECRAIHLAARLNLKNNFLKNIYFGRVMVWCELEDHPFF